MTHQAASVEEREGEIAGSADQEGELLLLPPQLPALGVRQVGLGALDQPESQLAFITDIKTETFIIPCRLVRIFLNAL